MQFSFRLLLGVVAFCCPPYVISGDNDCKGYKLIGNPFLCGVHGNCVWWAIYKRPELGAYEVHDPISEQFGNWYEIAKNAGFGVGQSPADGAIAVFSNPSHVAYIEKVNKGLRTVAHRRIGGSYLTISGIHRMLTNPFYAGILVWNNQVHRGAHQPMVTMEELERVRKFLRRAGKPTPQKRDFPLTGLIRCGECGFMVTAETKTNRYESRYTYYHCSKRRLDYRCKQPSVRAEDLEAMVKQKLSEIRLAVPLHEFFTQSMDEAEGLGKRQRLAEKRSAEKALRDTEAWLTNLRHLHVRGRFSQEEFEQEEREIRQEQFRLQESLSQIEVATSQFEFEEMLDSFSEQAIFRFETGDSRQKRLIVRAVSSNTVLEDKVLRIEARKPFVGMSDKVLCSYKLGC